MLRHDILARYILSRYTFCRVRQVTIRLKLASSTPACTLRPRLDPRLDPVIPLVAPTCALERTSNGSRNHPAPSLGRGPRCDAGTQPSGDPRYAGHYRRVRESAGRRPDPELPGGVLSDHPRFPPVAADAAGSLAFDGPGILHGQHSGGAPARRDVAGDGGRLQRAQEAVPGTRADATRD